jgi:hypothetical protein
MLNFCGIVVAIFKMATGRNSSMSGINSGHHYDRSPLEEQFCVFKISRCLPFSKWLPKYGIKNGG